MNVIDIPQPAGEELYDEAVSHYTRMVKHRAVAVHRVGSVGYAGLSPIRLLVVTDRTGVDNRCFFSVLARLPQRYHRLFLHEPFVLPVWSLRVMGYTRHNDLHLAAGRDVLQPYVCAGEPDERWCRTLEAYCEYAAFTDRVRDSQTLPGRTTIAAALAFGGVIATAASVIPEAENGSYAGEITALAHAFFHEGRDHAESVRAAWSALSQAFTRFDEVMRARLHAGSNANAAAAARARLLGEEACDSFDREYAFRRAREIDGYHQELASLGLPFGHLFFTAAYPGAVRELPATPLVDLVVDHLYRMRRQLAEYALSAVSGSA